MTILVRTLFLSLMMVGSVIFTNATPNPTATILGGTMDIIQVDRTAEVVIDRSQLPTQLQNQSVVIKVHNAQEKLVISPQRTSGDSVVFSTKHLPEDIYTIELQVGYFKDYESFTLKLKS